jgi:hypothetical protein
MVQTSKDRGGLYQNPNEMSFNPRNIYPDDVIEGYVNPAYPKTYRPRGSLYVGNSDFRKLISERRLNRPGGRRMVFNRLFAEDITGEPWASTQPEWLAAGGPNGPVEPALAHDAGMDSGPDVRNKYGRNAQVAEEVNAQGGDVVRDWTDIGAIWNSLNTELGTIPLIFLGTAGVIVFGSLLGFGPLARAGRGAERTVAAAGGGVSGTSGGAIDSVNKTLGAASDAVSGIQPGRS